jgi:hypothetical protein
LPRVLFAAEVVACMKERDGEVPSGFSCRVQLERGGKWKGATGRTVTRGRK